MHWYVLRVAANKEMQVKEALERKVDAGGSGRRDRAHRGADRADQAHPRRQADRAQTQALPGYVFMEMEADRGRSRAGGGVVHDQGHRWVSGDFIGTEGMPTPMRDTDVAKMLLEAEKPEEAPSIKVEFQKGDHIKIREGAFENFEGSR